MEETDCCDKCFLGHGEWGGKPFNSCGDLKCKCHMSEVQDQIEVIRAACVAAHSDGFEFPEYYPVVHLADVLLAIQDKTRNEYGYYITDTGVFAQTGGKARANWDLRQDDLAAQSPATIQFLYDLLATPSK